MMRGEDRCLSVRLGATAGSGDLTEEEACPAGACCPEPEGYSQAGLLHSPADGPGCQDDVALHEQGW